MRRGATQRRLRAWALVLLGAAAATAHGAELRAGFARSVITPTLDGRPVYLAGFAQGRHATHVHDDLFARAVAMSDGERTIVIVSVDLIGLFQEEIEKMRRLLAARRGPGVELAVAATHNHEGPDTLGLWGPSPLETGVDPRYLAAVRERVVEAAQAALDRLTPARLVVAEARTRGLIADSRSPEIVDDLLTVAQAVDGEGRTLGVIVNWGNHPEALGASNTRVTADYPHYLNAEVERALGGTSVFLVGAVGGLMSPLGVRLTDTGGRPIPGETFEHAQAVGERAARAAVGALRAALPSTTPARVECRRREVFLPLGNPLYRAAWALGLIDRTFYTRGRPDRRVLPGLSGAGALALPQAEALRTEVGWLRLGGLEMLLVPGEIYPEIVVGGIPDPQDPAADFPGAPREGPLAALLRSPWRMIVGLANDEIGYVIPRSEWDREPPFTGGREAAQYGEINSVGDRVAPLLAEAFEELLR